MKACARINTTFVKTAKITTLKRYQFVIADVKALFFIGTDNQLYIATLQRGRRRVVQNVKTMLAVCSTPF